MIDIEDLRVEFGDEHKTIGGDEVGGQASDQTLVEDMDSKIQTQ